MQWIWTILRNSFRVQRPVCPRHERHQQRHLLTQQLCCFYRLNPKSRRVYPSLPWPPQPALPYLLRNLRSVDSDDATYFQTTIDGHATALMAVHGIGTESVIVHEIDRRSCSRLEWQEQMNRCYPDVLLLQMLRHRLQ